MAQIERTPGALTVNEKMMCLGKSRNYQEMVEVRICDKSDENENENLDLYSENEDSDDKISH
ncbi:11090_t:CDS:2 [Gigaspora margarita]|uniref:11090_t:CDS:1 n=1 Tax=Gigaspora margarita TaxID=4874 RepID=A0ABN7V9J4_GIGMA|nr:11090_t:CDS:2 [Gigaspora margarita]